MTDNTENINQRQDSNSAMKSKAGAIVDRLQGPQTIGNSRSFWLSFLGLVAIALVLPLLTSTYIVNIFTSIFIFAFLALSLSLVWGYTGIFSFGQTAFFGLGAYVFGIAAINLFETTGATNVALLAAVGIPGIVAAGIGYFMFYGRVSGVYVAIITLATTLILQLTFSQSSGVSIGSAQLGGYNGLVGIPPLSLGYGSVAATLADTTLYYFVVLTLLVVYLLLRYVLNSSTGYSMVAIREDETRTELVGYNIKWIKLAVFTVAGGMAGFGGALYAAWGFYATPQIMGLTFAISPVIWVLVGGRKLAAGAILGTVIIRYIDLNLALWGSGYSQIFLGALAVSIVLLAPEGILPMLGQYLPRVKNYLPGQGGTER